MTRGRIAIAGAVAQRPRRGGHAWVFLQYLLGFREAGWEVLFLDRLEPGMCEPVERDDPGGSTGAAWLDDTLARFGLGEAYALFGDDGRTLRGWDRERVLSYLSDADLLFNFMGYLDDPDLLGAVERRVFVDLDPGFDQIWYALGLADLFAGHDTFVTVGLNVGSDECAIPACGKRWIPTLQPVVLSEWDDASPPGRSFSSVVTWRGDYAPLEYAGRRYGLRAHEFRRFVELPLRTGHRYELALDIDHADHADRARLDQAGWQLLDPARVAGDPDAYRGFIRRSMGEFQVSKGVYVNTHSGWFSDRSACYLASGRPVIAQDTGLGSHLPDGDGLLLFRTPDEAAAASDWIASDPRRHGRAARDIAVEHFAAERVLPALLDALSRIPADDPTPAAVGGLR